MKKTVSVKMESADYKYSWCAGFFDGEGTTTTTKAMRDKYNYIKMTITQKDREVLDKFERIVGKGKIYFSKSKGMYSWNCYKVADVVEVIKVLWQFLGSLKREQILKSIEKYNEYRIEEDQIILDLDTSLWVG